MLGLRGKPVCVLLFLAIRGKLGVAVVRLRKRLQDVEAEPIYGERPFDPASPDPEIIGRQPHD